MNVLKRKVKVKLTERLWAPVLILLFVLTCGLFVQAMTDQPEVRTALGAALRAGPVI